MVKHTSNTKQVNNYDYNINDSRKATQRRSVGAKGLLEREAACRDERECVFVRASERERVQNTTHNTTREREIAGLS